MKKERRHTITEKYPFIAIVIWFLLAIITADIFTPLIKVSGLLSNLSDPDAPSNLGSILGAILFLMIMKLWYAPEYKGILKPAISTKQVLLACVPLIVYSIIVLILTLIQYDFYFNGSLSNTLMALSAGFFEEILVRVSIIPITMGFFKSEKRAWLVPILSGTFFGLLHIGNIFNGATLLNSIAQVVVNIFTGFYYGTLLVATGSIVPGILLHGLYDYICLTTDKSLASGIMVSELSASEIIWNLILVFGLAVSAAVILKKLGTPKIIKIWKDKWSKE